jgi:hypothetical protein
MKKFLGTLAFALLIGVSALASLGSRAACDPSCCVEDNDVTTCTPACEAPSETCVE